MQPYSQRAWRVAAGLLVAALVLIAFAVNPGQAAGPDGSRIYDSIPSPYPGGFPSEGFQATSTDEFGDHIAFADTERGLGSVVVSMTNWACGNDFTWNGSTWVPKVGTAPCTTDNTTGTGYNHPITLNLYNVDNSGPKPKVGSLIATKTQSFFIPFRPSATPAQCNNDPFRWYNPADGICYNGYAFNIEFDFSASSITLPDEIIYGVAYNTFTHGANPLGVDGPYSSLNLSLATTGALIGTDVETDAIFHDSSWSGAYCSPVPTPLDVFQRDGVCWAPYTPAVRFNLKPAVVSLSPAAPLVCNSDTVYVDFSDVPDMYGYEFKVEYDATKVTPTAAFVNTWFNTTGSLIPPGWAAQCAAGVCKFASSLQTPAAPVTGDGRVAQIALTAVSGGTFNLKIKDVVLTNLDGFAIPATIADDTIEVGVCGTAKVAGKVSLQGRLTPMDAGQVKFIDTGGHYADIVVPFDANGNYSATNIPVRPTGSTYKIQVTHILYVGNEKTQLLLPGANLTGQNTRLLGGDADNSGLNPPFALGVDISDLGCLGSSFGVAAPTPCTGNPNSSTDINKDLITNIQDLSLAGGNYGRNPFQPW